MMMMMMMIMMQVLCQPKKKVIFCPFQSLINQLQSRTYYFKIEQSCVQDCKHAITRAQKDIPMGNIGRRQQTCIYL